MKKWIGIVIVGVLVSVFAWNLFAKDEGSSIVQMSGELKDIKQSQLTEPNQARQMVATDFELPMLSGETMRLSDTRGKITILNFWASWCEPCKLEAPHLQTFYEANSDRVEIVAVNVTKRDSAEKAQGFVDEYGFTFPVLLDETAEVSTTYGAFTIPTTIFLNEQGKIVQQFVGPMEEEFLAQVVDSI